MSRHAGCSCMSQRFGKAMRAMGLPCHSESASLLVSHSDERSVMLTAASPLLGCQTPGLAEKQFHGQYEQSPADGCTLASSSQHISATPDGRSCPGGSG